jgi:myo-inositol-1(or 4)-monophosphatase
MTASLEARFDFALDLIREAGASALEYFGRLGSLTIRSKGLQDVASEADLNTEMLIRERLAKAFPGDGFLGEETGTAAFDMREGIWVVDPIDGTQPFVSGMSSWCVSIAFVRNGVLQFGAVYSPPRNELFAGLRGRPATLNGQPVTMHPATDVTHGILGMGYSPRVTTADFLPMFTRVLDAGGTFYRDGSGALTLCYVACGRLIGYMEPHINSWDCLGAIAVIEAAGGVTSDFLAHDGLFKGNALVAGPPALFPQLDALFRGA